MFDLKFDQIQKKPKTQWQKPKGSSIPERKARQSHCSLRGMTCQSNVMKRKGKTGREGVPLLLVCKELSRASECARPPASEASRSSRVQGIRTFNLCFVLNRESWLKCGILNPGRENPGPLLPGKGNIVPKQGPLQCWALIWLKHCLSSFWRHCSGWILHITCPKFGRSRNLFRKGWRHYSGEIASHVKNETNVTPYVSCIWMKTEKKKKYVLSETGQNYFFWKTLMYSFLKSLAWKCLENFSLQQEI